MSLSYCHTCSKWRSQQHNFYEGVLNKMADALSMCLAVNSFILCAGSICMCVFQYVVGQDNESHEDREFKSPSVSSSC